MLAFRETSLKRWGCIFRTLYEFPCHFNTKNYCKNYSPFPNELQSNSFEVLVISQNVMMQITLEPCHSLPP
jgi:hypothetical protein